MSNIVEVENWLISEQYFWRLITGRILEVNYWTILGLIFEGWLLTDFYASSLDDNHWVHFQAIFLEVVYVLIFVQNLWRLFTDWKGGNNDSVLGNIFGSQSLTNLQAIFQEVEYCSIFTQNSWVVFLAESLNGNH